MQFRDWLSELFASLSDAIFNNEAGGEKVLSKKDVLFFSDYETLFIISIFFQPSLTTHKKYV